MAPKRNGARIGDSSQSRNPAAIAMAIHAQSCGEASAAMSSRISDSSMSNQPGSSAPLSYRDAGVDIDAGDALVEAIKPFARRTMRPEVLAGIGGFGALCEIPKKYRQPVLVS